MSLDYSQKRLLSTSFYRNAHKQGRATGSRAILFPMARRKSWRNNLEIYAFWTGFMSTVISLVQVILLATKN